MSDRRSPDKDKDDERNAYDGGSSLHNQTSASSEKLLSSGSEDDDVHGNDGVVHPNPVVLDDNDIVKQFQARYDNFTPSMLHKSGVKGQVSEARDDLLSTLRDIGKKHLNKNELLLGQWLNLHKAQSAFEKTDFFKLSQTEYGAELREHFSPANIMRTIQLWHNRFSRLMHVCYFC